MNVRTVGLVDGGARLGDLSIKLPPSALAAAKQSGLSEVVVGVRPEAADISAQPSGLSMEVELVEELGADTYVYGVIPGDTDARHFVARPQRHISPDIGETVHLTVDESLLHVFDPTTGNRLG
jgi:multiple sugar transport system ATP-binding protein